MDQAPTCVWKTLLDDERRYMGGLEAEATTNQLVNLGAGSNHPRGGGRGTKPHPKHGAQAGGNWRWSSNTQTTSSSPKRSTYYEKSKKQKLKKTRDTFDSPDLFTPSICLKFQAAPNISNPGAFVKNSVTP